MNILLLSTGNYSQQQLSEYIARLQGDAFRVETCEAPDFYVRRRFSVALNPALLAQVLGRVEAFRPGIVLCLDILSAWIGSHISSDAKVAWLGDLNFETFWYHAWYDTKEKVSRAIHLPAEWIRSQVWKRIYRDVLARMDSVIVSAKVSEDHLSRLGIASTYHPYPWPNGSSANRSHSTTLQTIPSFLFLGSLIGLGSRSAFHFMISGVYPRLLRLWGRNGFQIFISGMHDLPVWVRRALAGKPEFKYLGFVDEIGALMASCHAVLAPIDVPVGNRSRIITAMANGALVIAHQNTALGNPDLVDGQTCYLAANPTRFAERMHRTIRYPEEAAAIGANARACYETRFRPDVATAMLLTEISRVLTLKDGPHA